MLKLDRRMRRELRRKLRVALGLRNTFGDRIIITDEVLVWQGDKLLFKSKGHIVNQGLIQIINAISLQSTANPAGPYPSYNWTAITGGRMRVGIGTGVTVSTMTSLVNEQATNPNTQSGATASPVVGTYRVSWIATWNAGALPAINVSEIGLYLNMQITLQAFGATIVTGSTNQLFSRLSDSDGDFTTFLVNTAVPLTVEWRLTFTFA